MSSPARWFLSHGGQRSGPFDLDALVDRLLALPDRELAMVWREGLAGWQQAGTTPELASKLPPPLPPPVEERVAAPSVEPPPPDPGAQSAQPRRSTPPPRPARSSRATVQSQRVDAHARQPVSALLTMLVVLGLWAQVAILALLAGSLILARGGAISNGVALVQRLASLEMLTFCVTSVLFLVWFYKAVAAIQPGARQKPRGLWSRAGDFSPLDAVIYWFVPFYNLVRPPQVMRELWNRSMGRDRETSTTGQNPAVPKVPIVSWWWRLFILAAVLDRAVASDKGSPGSTGTLLLVSGWVLTLTIDAVLMIFLVSKIGRAQEAGGPSPDETVGADGGVPPAATAGLWFAMCAVIVAVLTGIGLESSSTARTPAAASSAPTFSATRGAPISEPVPSYRRLMGLKGPVSRVVIHEEDPAWSPLGEPSTTDATITFTQSGLPIEWTKSMFLPASYTPAGIAVRRVDRWRYEGDVLGRPVSSVQQSSRTIYGKDGTPDVITSDDYCTFSYAALAGLVLTTTCKYARGVETYDADGRLLRREFDNGVGTVETEEHGRDEAGCVVSVVKTTTDAPVSPNAPPTEVEFAQKSRNRPSEPARGVPTTTNYTCERKGNVLTIVEIRSGIFSTTSFYTLDAHGNETELTKAEFGTTRVARTTTLEYFKN